MTYVPVDGEFDVAWNDPNSDFAFAPMGLMGNIGVAREVFENVRGVDYCPDLFNEKAEYKIDFTNPRHVYELLEHYEEFQCAATVQPLDGMWTSIIKTLDYYIDRALLKEQHRIILELKKRKVSNRAITTYLNKKLGLTHTENYISTLWTHKICEEIAAAAKNHYDEFIARDDDNAWKKCNTCGELKFLSGRFFVKKARSKDGFSNRCKCCDKIERIERKGGK